MKSFVYHLSFVFGLFLFSCVALAQNTEPTITLQVGQKYPLEGLLPEFVEIKPDHIVSIHRSSEGILLHAKEVGAATLAATVQNKKIEIKIIVKPQSTNHEFKSHQPKDLISELKTLPGIQISKLHSKVVIQGEILGRSAYQKILLALKTFGKDILLLARCAPGVQESLIEQAHSMLQNRGFPFVEVHSAGHRFFLEGSVATANEVHQALEIVQSVIPNIENHIPIPIHIDPTVSIRISILELSRRAHETLGLSWPATIHGAAIVNPKQILFSPIWSASIRHLSSLGQAKVLAEPLIAVKSGSAAELKAGGEIPLRVTGQFMNKVLWKHYGLKIRVHVVGISGRHIRTKINSESSQLDHATAVDGIPGIKNNHMETEVDAIEGQPILLTGLFQNDAARDVEKVPFLGSIPILGELFKSRNFRESESELLIALLPSLGAPHSNFPARGARGLEFDMKWGIFD